MTSLIVFILVVKLYGWWWGLLALLSLAVFNQVRSYE